ncbi:MAG: AAA family ATPase, partial [Nitrospira sp.]
MYLKTLELTGFKSFAEARINFPTGVTAIVGPNGTGKSNIVDAILWVLGEQSPKSALRCEKMEDVIFNGTKKRPALGRAEVMLTLDNSAGLLPLEFSEVTISRTLFRNGDSEYAING